AGGNQCEQSGEAGRLGYSYPIRILWCAAADDGRIKSIAKNVCPQAIRHFQRCWIRIRRMTVSHSAENDVPGLTRTNRTVDGKDGFTPVDNPGLGLKRGAGDSGKSAWVWSADGNRNSDAGCVRNFNHLSGRSGTHEIGEFI